MDVLKTLRNSPNMDSRADERVVNTIIAFREGRVKVHPGGGQYERVELSEIMPDFQNNPEP